MMQLEGIKVDQKMINLDHPQGISRVLAPFAENPQTI
jgi:hypothetical protein